MTREEAIHFAECLKHNWTIDFNDMEDFCDMAIEALQFAEHFDLLKEYQSLQEVVRCKDCKHYIVEGITTQYGWCHEYKHSVDEDDYCSYGERREESEVEE